MSVLKRVWLPLVIVFVVAIAGFAVNRIRGFFGADGIIVTPRSSPKTQSRSIPKW